MYLWYRSYPHSTLARHWKSEPHFTAGKTEGWNIKGRQEKDYWWYLCICAQSCDYENPTQLLPEFLK